MTVRVVFIRRLSRHLEPDQHHEGDDDVIHGLDAIRNEGIGMTEDADAHFDAGQNGIEHDAQDDGLDGDLAVAHAGRVEGNRTPVVAKGGTPCGVIIGT